MNCLICDNQCLTFYRIKSLGIQLDFNQITAPWILNYIFTKPYVTTPSKSLLLFKIITFLVFPQQLFVIVVQQPHELQYIRLLCPSLSPWVCSNSCALSQWCHPTISSSVAPFSSCPQFFPSISLFQWVSSSHQVSSNRSCHNCWSSLKKLYSVPLFNS